MAMPNVTKMFPRGYSGGQSQYQSAFTNRGGDTEVNKLWEEYTSEINNSTQWGFRKRVIKATKRLLSTRSNWFISQDHNPYIDSYNYQFVIDTLRFIGKGTRRINIHAWRDLVSNSPENGLINVAERHEIADQFELLKLTTSVDALIKMWCTRPGGFDDMMITLNILFGDLPVRTVGDKQ